MVTTRDVEYDADGTLMVGRLALPDGEGRRPAVLIAHEGPGLDDYQKDRASRFAELGYVAFALDYHGGGKPLGDRDAMMARLASLWETLTAPARSPAQALRCFWLSLGPMHRRLRRSATASAAP